LGVGMSALSKWIAAHRDTDVVSKEDLSLDKENDRLRRENRLLMEESDILKKPPSSSRVYSNGISFIEEHRCSFPVNWLCAFVGVSTRGFRAYRSRPASRRQRSDLVTLVHIKEQSRLSLGCHGRPRMTES
jgi:putative transposase